MTFSEQVAWNLTHVSPASDVELPNTYCEICGQHCNTPGGLYSHYCAAHDKADLINLYEFKQGRYSH